MLISIIVPIYNVQEYLSLCLGSLERQIDTHMEVILVNDGSTDNSFAICEEFAQKHSNTIIINKENGGLSDARNAGTVIAQGNYIYYLDSDDWLAPDAIKTLYDFALANNCEIVQGGFYYAYEDYLLYDNSIKTAQVLNREGAMFELITNESVKDFSWGKLYRADIVKKHMFPQGKYFEDSYWQHLVVHDSTRYGIVPTPLYYYRQRSSGISGTFSLKSLDLLQGYEERLEFIKGYYSNYTSEMVLSLWDTFYSLMSVANKQEESKKAFENYWEVLNEKYGSLFEKYLSSDLRFRIRKTCPSILPLYDYILRIKSRIESSNLVKISLK